MGKLYVIGIRPGGLDEITLRAVKTIEESSIIAGYTEYAEMVKDLIKDKEIFRTGMRGKEERCRETLESSKNKKVALMSTGGSGIYGMAGLISKVRENENIEIIPSITTFSAVGLVLGAPLMYDNCNISLSDLTTPYEDIKKRVRFAAGGDFVIFLYNPKSKRKPHYLREYVDIVKELRRGETPIAVVRDALREGESKEISILKDFNDEVVGMFSIIIIGNSKNYIRDGYFVAPRGYRIKG